MQNLNYDRLRSMGDPTDHDTILHAKTMDRVARNVKGQLSKGWIKPWYSLDDHMFAVQGNSMFPHLMHPTYNLFPGGRFTLDDQREEIFQALFCAR